MNFPNYEHWSYICSLGKVFVTAFTLCFLYGEKLLAQTFCAQAFKSGFASCILLSELEFHLSMLNSSAMFEFRSRKAFRVQMND